MNGPRFFQTGMGRTFYEGTMPKLVKQLKRLNDNLESKSPKQEESVFVKQCHLIKFARLLCSIKEHCEMEGFDQVMESLDLGDEDVNEIFGIAEKYKDKQ